MTPGINLVDFDFAYVLHHSTGCKNPGTCTLTTSLPILTTLPRLLMTLLLMPLRLTPRILSMQDTTYETGQIYDNRPDTFPLLIRCSQYLIPARDV